MKPLRTFEIQLSDSHPIGPTTLVGSIFPTRARASGRRIEIRDATSQGNLLFDSGDHYDLSNAANAMELWLAKVEKCANGAA